MIAIVIGGAIDAMNGNSLHNIVTTYLLQQHKTCANPITVLPEVSLLRPHSCPVPSGLTDGAQNISALIRSRETGQQFGGRRGRSRTRQLVYSRFCPWRKFTDSATLHGMGFKCASFFDGPFELPSL